MKSELTGRRAHARQLEFLREVDDRAVAVEAAYLSGVLHGATGGRMPIPAACTGPEGTMFYSWDCGRHHLELEIAPGEPAYFFYGHGDRESGGTWSQKYAIPCLISSGPS
jgi:hypothetical protein